MKVWITKYALTRDIEQVDAELLKSGAASYGKYGYAGSGAWSETRADAIKRAEAMRVAKIASLEKQIAKLRAMKFGGAR